MRLASAADAQALQTRIAGWMMGLILMLERNQTGGDANLSLSLRGGGEERVFDYFIDEVFRKYDAGSRDLLMQSALLPTMTIRAVTELTGTPRCGALLRELAGKNHFVMRLAGTVPAYQFHPLFREFLLHQAAARYSQSELASLHRAAARGADIGGRPRRGDGDAGEGAGLASHGGADPGRCSGADRPGPDGHARRMDQHAAARSDRWQRLDALLVRDCQDILRFGRRPGQPGNGVSAVPRARRPARHGPELVRHHRSHPSHRPRLPAHGCLDRRVRRAAWRRGSEQLAPDLRARMSLAFFIALTLPPAPASRHVTLAGTRSGHARRGAPRCRARGVAPAPRHAPHPARRARPG